MCVFLALTPEETPTFRESAHSSGLPALAKHRNEWLSFLSQHKLSYLMAHDITILLVLCFKKMLKVYMTFINS